jgi:uncharacterized protein
MSSPSDPPSSDPFKDGIRPMPFFVALGWVIGTTFALALLMTIANDNIVSRFACQAVAYLLGLFLILRVHAPLASLREFLAIRGTHAGFYPLAVLLGVAVEIPAILVQEFIRRRYPEELVHSSMLTEIASASLPQRIATGAVLIALGPFLEEVFFRGAIFKPMERKYTDARSIVIGLTAVLFALAHFNWRELISLAMVGLVLGYLRQASGSIIPGVLLHATINGVAFYSLLTEAPGAAETHTALPRWLLAAGCFATLLLLAFAHLLSTRTQAAARAQELDRQ